MTAPLTPVARARKALASAIALVPGIRVALLGTQISPPAAVIGPPKLIWSHFGTSSTPTTAQWAVYIVVALNQNALDDLNSLIASVSAAIELYTPGVVLGSAPGQYPSPGGSLPAHMLTVQIEMGMT